MKKLFIGLMFFILVASTNATTQNSSSVNASAPIIGGFGAPQFFTKYDKSAINKIASNPNAKTIKISYPPQLKSLAKRIDRTIKAKSSAKITMEEVNLQDTATVKYRHDAVVVVLYFK